MKYDSHVSILLPAALKNCVHPARPRREVQYVIAELVHRLHHANDWLVRICGESHELHFVRPALNDNIFNHLVSTAHITACLQRQHRPAHSARRPVSINLDVSILCLHNERSHGKITPPLTCFAFSTLRSSSSFARNLLSSCMDADGFEDIDGHAQAYEREQHLFCRGGECKYGLLAKDLRQIPALYLCQLSTI